MSPLYFTSAILFQTLYSSISLLGKNCKMNPKTLVRTMKDQRFNWLVLKKRVHDGSSFAYLLSPEMGLPLLKSNIETMEKYTLAE